MQILNWRGELIFEADGNCKSTVVAANEQGISLQGANLHDRDLFGADLRDADLRGAGLRWTILVNADLSRAQLYGANLRGADLRGANLTDATMYGVDMRGADITEAVFGGTHMCGVAREAPTVTAESLRDAGAIVGQRLLICRKCLMRYKPAPGLTCCDGEDFAVGIIDTGNIDD